MSNTARWICEICNTPIVGAGFVEIVDERTGDWRMFDTDAIEERPSVTADDQVNDAVLSLIDPAVTFHVYHDTCVPDERDTGYVIQCVRAASLSTWIAWVIHISQKNWMRKGDVVRMLAFWYYGHGEQPPLDLT